MASRMAMFYMPQITQMNEESPLESYLDLTLTQHLCDEYFKLQKVRTHLEIKPPQAWYYCISLNSHTLMILLQVDLASGDELEIIYEGCYKTKHTSIFTWSLIFGVEHYRWFRGPIRRLLPYNKVDYLVHTIRCILNFLEL